MLNNYVNFDFYIMKKLWDVGHEKFYYLQKYNTLTKYASDKMSTLAVRA